MVIRGARQVGKTWLVRDLAHSQQLHLLELNFERDPGLQSLFQSNDPREVLQNLQATIGRAISPRDALLFLDEIQAAPHLLAKLRWFAEEMPELAVIAAGSLLDFALEQHSFSMPVGRVHYMYLEPLSFEEFLEATNRRSLKEYVRSYTWDRQIPAPIHSQLIQGVREYLIIGGMPEAVSLWLATGSFDRVSQVHSDLLATYRDDFAKYRGRLSIDRLEEVMTAVPRQLGRKFVYSKVNRDIGSTPLKQALELLIKARVCHRISATAANGLPLGAEANEKFSKMIMLDSGLCSASFGLSLHQLQSVDDLTMINSGGMAEQLVGQLLRTISPPYIPAALYYWLRTEPNAAAEVDYIVQHENQIVPVEVKAGASGKLKSLHEFVRQKEVKRAVRIYSAPPRKEEIRVLGLEGEFVEYTLISLPFYLIGQMHRLIATSN